jgi:hypothetical protein
MKIKAKPKVEEKPSELDLAMNKAGLNSRHKSPGSRKNSRLNSKKSSHITAGGGEVTSNRENRLKSQKGSGGTIANSYSGSDDSRELDSDDSFY